VVIPEEINEEDEIKEKEPEEQVQERRPEEQEPAKRYIVNLKLKDIVTGQQILDEINNIEELRNNDSCITSDFGVRSDSGEMSEGKISIKRNHSGLIHFTCGLRNLPNVLGLVLVEVDGGLKKWTQQLARSLEILDPTEPLSFESYDYKFLENLIEAKVGPLFPFPQSLD